MTNLITADLHFSSNTQWNIHENVTFKRWNKRTNFLGALLKLHKKSSWGFPGPRRWGGERCAEGGGSADSPKGHLAERSSCSDRALRSSAPTGCRARRDRGSSSAADRF
ncbi:hypothetical protein HispidOSU_009204 [Sigmodon hispidus]